MFNLTQVVLKNFRSFIGEHTFQLPQKAGLYLLTGKNQVNPRLGANGCGKSTLLEAIHWCLYGKTSRGLKAGDVVTWGKKSCEVLLDVKIANQKLSISRAQNPNMLTVFFNGSKPHTVSQEELEKLLRLGSTAFTYSAMIPQFGDSFFDLKPADKLTLFSDIMELDFWLDRSTAASIMADGHQRKREGFERELSNTQGKIETITEDIKGFIAKQAEFKTAQKLVMSKIENEISELKVFFETHYKELSDIGKQRIAAINRLEKLENKTTKKCPTCKQPIHDEQAIKDRKSLERNIEDFSRLHAVTESKGRSATEKLKDKKELLSKENTKKNPYSELRQGKEAELTKLKDKLAELSAAIDGANEKYKATNFWVGGFKRVRLFIIEKTLRQLEIEVNNNLASLGLVDWGVQFDVERENKSGGITKGFVVLIQAPGHAEPVRWEAWSGGETQRLRLAGDLGLANLIMEQAGLTNTIEFYDEPSKHLSQEGLLDMAETLYNRAVSTGKRIILVDHHAIEFGDFEDTITIVKDNKGSHIQ